MRRFLGLMMFICLLFSGNCFAMQFSQPVQIGAFGQFPNQGFTFYYGTIINSGVYFDENDEEKGYKKISQYFFEIYGTYIYFVRMFIS